MMKALTIRDKATGTIVCMGPADGMYDHRCDPETQTKQFEEDYDGLMAQHIAELASRPKPPSIEERLAVVEAKVR